MNVGEGLSWMGSYVSSICSPSQLRLWNMLTLAAISCVLSNGALDRPPLMSLVFDLTQKYQLQEERLIPLRET